MKFTKTLLALVAVTTLCMTQAHAGSWRNLTSIAPNAAATKVNVHNGNVQIHNINGVDRVRVENGNVSINQANQQVAAQPNSIRERISQRYTNTAQYDDAEVLRAISNTRLSIRDGNVQLRDGFSGVALKIQDGNVRIGNLSNMFRR